MFWRRRRRKIQQYKLYIKHLYIIFNGVFKSFPHRFWSQKCQIENAPVACQVTAVPFRSFLSAHTTRLNRPQVSEGSHKSSRARLGTPVFNSEKVGSRAFQLRKKSHQK